MIKRCLFCGKEFTPKLYSSKPNSKPRFANREYCTEKCRYTANFRKHRNYYQQYWLKDRFKWKGIRKCQYCNKEFEVKVFNQKHCSIQHRRTDWKKKHWEQVKASERIRLKRKRLENPEKYRFMVKTRKALRRESSGSGKTFNRNFTIQVWQEMKKLCNYTCLLCNRKEPEIKLTIDHIIPLSKRGKHLTENIQPLCFSCNSSKRDLLR